MKLWQELRDVFEAAGVPDARYMTSVKDHYEPGIGFVMDVTTMDVDSPNATQTTTHLLLGDKVEWKPSSDPGTPIYDAVASDHRRSTSPTSRSAYFARLRTAIQETTR